MSSQFSSFIVTCYGLWPCCIRLLFGLNLLNGCQKKTKLYFIFPENIIFENLFLLGW